MLRLVVGLTLSTHGAQKLFGSFGGPGLKKTAAFMEQLGFVPGERSAVMAGLAEMAGGLLLALGLVTPVAAGIVLSVMLVAAVTVHLEHGFFIQNGGYEYTLMAGLAALSVAFTGAGRISFDHLLGLRMGGVRWGVAALGIGLLGAGLQLASRHRPSAAGHEGPAGAHAQGAK